jgi:plastocyanin
VQYRTDEERPTVNRTRRLLLALVPAVLAFTLTACGGGGGGDGGDGGASSGGGTQATPAAGGGTTVAVIDNEFDPADLSVSAGDTVTWEWKGAIPHNVKGDGFESEIQDEGTFTHTFDSAGEYPYECTVHPGMEGTITVQ